MKHSVEKLEKSQVKFTFKLTSEEWDKAIEAAYHKTKNKYSCQGFRKGKMPRRMIESMYGVGVFFEDAFNICFPEYYGMALDKNPDIFPVDRPDVDISNIDENGVEFVAVVTVKPEVTLGEYKGIEYLAPKYAVSGEELEEALSREQEKLSRLVDVTDRAAENGDTVIIDYSGSVDGVKFEGGTAEKQNLVLGSGSFIPGFEAQVEGMNIGDSKDVLVTFPAEYHASDLAGKEAVFAVKLHEIKKKEVPALDDEFAKDVSEFKTIAEYKTDLEQKLKDAKKQRVEWESENQLVDLICQNAAVEIPAAMISGEVDNMVQEMEYRMMYQGLKLEDYLKYTGSNMDKLKESYKETAEKHVKTQLVIDKIIKEEKIDADKASLDEKIKANAKEAKKTIKEYKESLDERQISQFKQMIIMDKLFAFLKENNIAK